MVTGCMWKSDCVADETDEMLQKPEAKISILDSQKVEQKLHFLALPLLPHFILYTVCNVEERGNEAEILYIMLQMLGRSLCSR